MTLLSMAAAHAQSGQACRRLTGHGQGDRIRVFAGTVAHQEAQCRIPVEVSPPKTSARCPTKRGRFAGPRARRNHHQPAPPRPSAKNEHVQLRGLSSPQMTLTTLNGHTVSSGDRYGPNIANGAAACPTPCHPTCSRHHRRQPLVTGQPDRRWRGRYRGHSDPHTAVVQKKLTGAAAGSGLLHQRPVHRPGHHGHAELEERRQHLSASWARCSRKAASYCARLRGRGGTRLPPTTLGPSLAGKNISLLSPVPSFEQTRKAQWFLFRSRVDSQQERNALNLSNLTPPWTPRTTTPTTRPT